MQRKILCKIHNDGSLLKVGCSKARRWIHGEE